MRNLAISAILAAGALAAWAPAVLADDAAAAAPAFSLWEPFRQQDDPKPDVPAQDVEQGPTNDLVDLEHIEINLLAGVLVFGSDFDSDPKGAVGLLVRAPLPALSRDVFGLDTDEFGGFLQLTFSAIDRETDPKAEDPNGILVFAALGLDYTMYQDEDFLARAQVGIQYGYFGGVTETDNGVGLLLGLQGGVAISEQMWLSVNPQLGIGGGGDILFFGQVGLNIAF